MARDPPCGVRRRVACFDRVATEAAKPRFFDVRGLSPPAAPHLGRPTRATLSLRGRRNHRGRPLVQRDVEPDTSPPDRRHNRPARRLHSPWIQVCPRPIRAGTGLGLLFFLCLNAILVVPLLAARTYFADAEHSVDVYSWVALAPETSAVLSLLGVE